MSGVQKTRAYKNLPIISPETHLQSSSSPPASTPPKSIFRPVHLDILQMWCTFDWVDSFRGIGFLLLKKSSMKYLNGKYTQVYCVYQFAKSILPLFLLIIYT